MILAEIAANYGTPLEFTEQIRLVLLLLPIGYGADCAALNERSAGEVVDLGPIEAFLATGSRAALVVGGAGEGKSTIASLAMERLTVDGVGVAALHLCKRADARRQDPLLVARSLIYQLALRRPRARAVVFERLLSAEGGDAEAAALLQDEDKATALLVAALDAAPGALLIVDGLDEARLGGGRNRVLELLLTVGAQAAGVRLLVLMRPDAVVQRRLELAFAGGVRAFTPAELLPGDGGGDGRQRVLRLVAGALQRAHPTAAVAGLDLDGAYGGWFEAEPPDGATRQLLALMVAALEPLTLAHLQARCAVGVVWRLGELGSWGVGVVGGAAR